MTVYIDNTYKVYTTSAEDRTAIETSAFDGMPTPVIECYIFIPKGQSYTKPNGVTVYGEFIQPWVTEKMLDNAQREYEKQLLKESQTELVELKSQKEDLLESYATGVNSI